MHRLKKWLIGCAVLLVLPAHAEKITVAAASDLRFAMGEIVTAFQLSIPSSQVEVIYGSSGKFHTQIQQGAPYDLYFSADIAFPRALAEQGFAAAEVVPYAFGRIVLWSATRDASEMTLETLSDSTIHRVAIANPRHAPYGLRAVEALEAVGVHEALEHKLVLGENIAHAAHFVQSGNAQAGIIALALAVSPELADRGGYWLIPNELHEPLEQGFIITRRAADNALARRFADYMVGEQARSVLAAYGFMLPDKP